MKKSQTIIATFEIIDATIFYGPKTKFNVSEFAKIANEYPDAKFDIKMLTGKEGQGRYIMTFYTGEQ